MKIYVKITGFTKPTLWYAKLAEKRPNILNRVYVMDAETGAAEYCGVSQRGYFEFADVRRCDEYGKPIQRKYREASSPVAYLEEIDR
jgi:hypothetical protein